MKKKRNFLLKSILLQLNFSLEKAGILLVLVLLLTGCGGKTDGMMQSALDFRSDLMKQEHCSFTLDITADFGEKVYRNAEKGDPLLFTKGNRNF